MASTLALASSRHPEPVQSRRLVQTVLWLALFFAPQAVYLLSRFPAWETMFVLRDPPAVPAWLAALLPASMVATGVAGFSATRALLRRGRRALALGLMTASFVLALGLVTVGWDGTGLRRMLYPGTGAEWAEGVQFSLADFLTSELSVTLAWLQPLVLAPYVLMMVASLRSRAARP